MIGYINIKTYLAWIKVKSIQIGKKENYSHIWYDYLSDRI